MTANLRTSPTCPLNLDGFAPSLTIAPFTSSPIDSRNNFRVGCSNQEGEFTGKTPTSVGRKTCADLSLDNSRHQADYTKATVSRFQSNRASPTKPGETMKVAKAESTGAEPKVWCESCCIRVAPNEEQIVIRGKTYHSHCYSKLNSKPKVDIPGLPV